MTCATEIELLTELAPYFARKGLVFKKQYKDLYDFVMEHTRDFGDASMSERMYCVINNIAIRPNLAFKTYERGYSSSNKEEEKKELIKYANLVGNTNPSHGSKIKTFINRNKQRNAELYLFPNTDENINFIICPVLGIRTLNIKKQYIEGILLMSVEEFSKKYPDQALSCARHKNILSMSLAEETIDGITKHQASVIKATQVRAELDENGESINSKKGRKTRETLMKIGEDGISGYQKIAAVARPKQRETLAKQGRVSSIKENKEWVYYRNFVNWLTVIHKKEVLDGKITGRAGTEGAYHVDHIYSIIHGFKNGISPWLISDRNNLQSIYWKENVKKSHKSTISFEDLCERTGYSKYKSQKEFEYFKKVINESTEKMSSLDIFERYNEKADTEFQKKYKI